MARKFGNTTAVSGKTILCIDDQTDFLEAVSSLLARQGHTVLTASDGTTGLSLLRSERVDLLLLDYFMPEMTAEDVLAHVWDPSLQVILLTGYASEKPPREMLNRLNIQGYCDKSRGPEELLLWVDVGLRAAGTVKALEASRQSLRQLLSTVSRPTERNPLEDVLTGLLSQAATLLGLRRGLIAVVENQEMFVPPSTFEESTLPEPGLESLRIAASLGAPDTAGVQLSEVLPDEVVDLLRTNDLDHEERFESGSLMCLRNEGLLMGILWIEPGPTPGSDNHELLGFIASQAALVIRRHAMATLDLISGLQSRGFWKQAAWRDLRSAMRFRQPVSLTTIGLLKMDSIPERSWDPVMAALGRLVQLTIRGTDLAMRETDNQLTVLLPHTDSEGAQRFGELLVSRLSELEIPLPEGTIQVEAVAASATFAPETIPEHFARAPVSPRFFERAENTLRERATLLLSKAALEGPGTSLIHDSQDWIQE